MPVDVNVWTDLTAMFYIVPLIAAAFVLLFAGAFFNLASLAEVRCPVCKARFGDIFERRRHIKDVESGKKKEEFKKAA